MRVTFLDHSGFLVETEFVTLLFDWWKGDLPALEPGGLPLYVFASHRHEDHFKPEIFALDHGTRDVRFLLGHGIKLRNLGRWGFPQSTAEKCRNLRGGEALELPRAKVEALSSTDEGAAFLAVLPDGRTVFHAGDLNWWHWEGEDKGWNRNMEVNFKKYAEPLRGRRIDLAMLPLDPRLGEAGFWGPAYFLETAEIRRFLPMHQWGEFDFTRKFLEKHSAFTDRVLPVKEPGQVFAL